MALLASLDPLKNNSRNKSNATAETIFFCMVFPNLTEQRRILKTAKPSFFKLSMTSLTVLFRLGTLCVHIA